MLPTRARWTMRWWTCSQRNSGARQVWSAMCAHTRAVTIASWRKRRRPRRVTSPLAILRSVVISLSSWQTSAKKDRIWIVRCAHLLLFSTLLWIGSSFVHLYCCLLYAKDLYTDVYCWCFFCTSIEHARRGARNSGMSVRWPGLTHNAVTEEDGGSKNLMDGQKGFLLPTVFVDISSFARSYLRVCALRDPFLFVLSFFLVIHYWLCCVLFLV